MFMLSEQFNWDEFSIVFRLAEQFGISLKLLSTFSVYFVRASSWFVSYMLHTVNALSNSFFLTHTIEYIGT